MPFIAYVAFGFESILTKIHSMKLLIHILYKKIEKLLWNIMSRQGEKCAVSLNKLLLLDLSDKKLVKTLKMIDIETKAKSLLVPSGFQIDENKKKFREDWLACYQKTVEQRERLPKLLPMFYVFPKQNLSCNKICDIFMTEWRLYTPNRKYP